MGNGDTQKLQRFEEFLPLTWFKKNLRKVSDRVTDH